MTASFRKLNKQQHRPSQYDCRWARGVNGWLAEPGDRDVFKVKGIKEQTWRFAAKARSFGSPPMLKMQLKNPAGQVVAKTAVVDSDEWQLDFKFPDDAEYHLECEDLFAPWRT